MAANQKRRSTGKSTTKGKARKKSGNQRISKEYHDEIVLIITLVVSLLLILSCFHLSGKVGEIINSVTFGIFGMMAYLIPYLLFFGTAFYISNRQNQMVVRKLISGIILIFILMGFFQMISGNQESSKLFYYYKESSVHKTGGGMIGGALCNLFVPLFGVVGTYIILIAIILILLVFITEKLLVSALTEKGGKTVANIREKRKTYLEERELDKDDYEYEEEVPKRKAKTVTLRKQEAQNLENKITKKEQKGKKSDKNNSLKMDMQEIAPKEIVLKEQLEKKQFGFQTQGESYESLEPVYEKELNSKFGQERDYDIKALASQIIGEGDFLEEQSFLSDLETNMEEEPILNKKEAKEHTQEPWIKNNFEQEQDKFFQEEPFELSEPFHEPKAYEELNIRKEPEDSFAVEEVIPIQPVIKEKVENLPVESVKIQETAKTQEPVKTVEVHNISEIQKAHNEVPVIEYQFPPIDLLSKPKNSGKSTSDLELKETAMKLQSTLESFGVKVTISNISCGPAVTRYELQPEQGVKVSKITNLSDDIKLNLAAADIRIEAPIPGKAAVGIEVPNKTNTAVMFRELIENKDFTEHSSSIAFAVGKDIGGQTVVTDIAKMPHLLIAGATGSGKSVCINTLIMSILYKANPADVKLIMVDPKVVELSVYNGIPHLLIPVVTDPKKASAALNWAVTEMTERYNKFAELGVRDIKGYNEKIKTVEEYQDEKYQKMPQIVIIVDELADLMMVAPGEVEDAICRLAQMARAAGLHLIIATQRPSVNVITGLIKANVPSRIAFSVSSAIDSRTIIDGAGAEKLLGKGDMLFFPSGYPKPVRIQGAFVSDKEVSDVVAFLSQQNSVPSYSDDIANKISLAGNEQNGGVSSASDKDDYFIEAGKFVIDKDKASIGMLQRVYKIGFNRAARIMDQLSEAGVVGPEEGTKPRKVLMSLEEFEQYVEEYV